MGASKKAAKVSKSLKGFKAKAGKRKMAVAMMKKSQDKDA